MTGILDRIRVISKEKKISIHKLAQDTGICETNFYRWNDFYPSSDKLQKVAEALGVSVERLMSDEYVDDEDLELLKNDDLRMLLKAGSKMKKEDVAFLLKMAERINGE